MRVRIWDLPVRLVHWALVLLVPALWATHHWEWMDAHILLGEIMLGLVLFRIIWGVLGSSTARFASFVTGPGAVMRYLGGRWRKAFGHNPLGGWSVVAMLLLLALQTGLGLFSSDEDGLYFGPLASSDIETAHGVAGWHDTVFWSLVGLIAVHVAALLWYRIVRRDDLITPMITGRGEAIEGEAEPAPTPLWRFGLSVLLSVAITFVIVRFL